MDVETKLIYTNNLGKVYSEKLEKHLLIDELEIAKHLANFGKTVILKKEMDISNIKNADAVVDGKIIEFKTISNATNFKRAIENALRRSKKQAKNTLLYIKQKFCLSDLYRGIETAIKFDKSKKITEIQILFSDGNLKILLRNQIENGSYKELLK